MEDPVASRNFQALKKKSYDIKFELEGTFYDPIENIGIGAYGVVCSAIHRRTRDKVAIKKIPSIFEQPTIAKRTYREIKILKHFKHDNIIAIREILKPAESTSEFKDVYIVLDLMESDLHRIIYSKQELSDEHVRYFLYQILRGLKYIHSANVIHRDLKPSNLLINENCDLKIGDFGMARGVSDKANEYNMMMTQYVATRWYRAPELIMLPTNYSAAVDMWSVGCILAEMLGKRQLFPGQNYMHQIKLIIGILGAPSSKFLKQINSDMLKLFIGGLGKKEPVPLKKLYPKAPNKAVDLLGKMLSLDPDNRITVEQALVHLYLNKYHDPDDEPVCVPVFNFDFEKQKFDGTQLRDCILKEIMDYHQPPRGKVFNLRPVPKAELKSPTSSKPPKVESSKAGNSSGLDAFLKYMNEQGGLRKPVAAPSAQSVDTKPQETLEQQLQLSVESLQQLQSNMATGTQLEPHQDQDGFLKPTGIPVQSKRPPKLSTKTSKTSVEGERSSTDVEMMSAKSSAKSDVEMLSAKSHDQPLDAKAQLKAALLEAHLRRQRNEASGEKPRPVTAQQRQKEREEKRRKKLERVQEKKRKEKKKGKDSSKLLLTDEDKSMLERWKNMQQKQPTNVSAAQSVSSDTATPAPLPPATPDAASSVQDLHIRNRIQNLGLQDQQTPDQQLATQDHTQPIQGQHLRNSSSDQALQDRNALTVTQDQIQNLPQDLNNPRRGFPEISDMNLPDLQARSDTGLATRYENFSHGNANFLPSESHLQDGLQAAPPGPGYFSQGSTTKLLKDSHVKPEPKTQALYATPKTDSQPVLPEIGPSYNLPTVTASWSQLAPLVSEQGETRLPTYDEAIQARAGQPLRGTDTVQQMMGASSYPCNQLLDNLSYPSMGVGPSTSYQNAPSSSTVPPHTLDASQGQSSPELLNSLSRLLWKSHVEDLTLAQTPKGTGGGYGVGLDLDEVLRDPVNNLPHDGDGGDSAPLSASLIADWLEVSGNMDPKDLEALQQELGLTSPSAFSGILSS